LVDEIAGFRFGGYPRIGGRRFHKREGGCGFQNYVPNLRLKTFATPQNGPLGAALTLPPTALACLIRGFGVSSQQVVGRPALFGKGVPVVTLIEGEDIGQYVIPSRA